jgi:hypothetical protein
MNPFLLINLLVLLSCSREKAPIQMNSYHRDRADTIYLEKISGLRDSLDALCEAHFETEVLKVRDSLIEVRKLEEQKIRTRLSANEE